ncbi:hypothetical protein GPECTOR_4g803 [Gonium pectorale]|uniref:LysM domain-containing protein n=1 Tax=Gonium pectorale TaxID=33097 RepID=A0A150GY66_GONPE|nr:hypothetical protein GPECTOR_4g803 [Gonium pectorale]|eukprot:KXZ54734.1 hypothetical protein GPECTOR_4g803 [Gonium pectorale]
MESSLESTFTGLRSSTEPSQEITSTSGQGDEQLGLSFIKHQVTKLDTLAGLAIKYNVSVGDIKRANGLLSDSALYARGTILIPSGHLPIGNEIQRLCAQVLTGVSRDPVLHAETQSQPASAAVARIATSLNVVNGRSYPEDVPLSEAAWMAMCQCGGCGPMDPNGLCLKKMQPVEVELADRSSEGMYLPPASAGPTRQHDMVRRRRNAADDADSCSDSANSYGWGLALRAGGAPADKGAAAAGRRPGDSSSDNGRLAAWFTEIGKAIGEGVSSTVAKVKEAANQPVLARPMHGSSSSGFGAAADALIAGRRRAGGPGSLLGRAPFEGGAPGGSSGALSALASVGAVRAKQGGKDD